ncbi:ribose transport system permease protein [Andreprevotia lacus DSM 23236]|jgi:ribose transport system permease protein|uniref:Ribose transport system permease protein n=1 Tax=Andreprevotia lacus DSM 23236 TaxID=1121001 RepID=A0A1W1WXG1_9NEIS|nr:ABC transporter permease [Andreprevotia lacus]SMC16270.1 ribose transport system permease protein [Andreprevotia lacus DSM 23236]
MDIAVNAPATAAKKRAIQWNTLLIYIVFVVIFLFFSITLHDKGFLQPGNLMNIARQTAMISIMAVGMTFVLSAAEIDLSFCAIVALSAVTVALLLPHGMIVAVGAALLVGAFCGLVNGLFVSKVGIPSFLVTLGTAGIITGITRWITELQTIPVDNETFAFIFGSGDLGPISVLFVWMVAIAVLGHVLLRKTRFGKEVLASGGNKISAMYSGIQVNRIKLYVLVLNAVLAALAGILYAGRLQSARYTLGENDLMMVIAAVIIGGTSLFGGKGTVAGTMVGALIMGMVNNGLVLMGLNIDQQLIFRGVIIIFSVTLTMGHLRKKH